MNPMRSRPFAILSVLFVATLAAVRLAGVPRTDPALPLQALPLEAVPGWVQAR